jgi:predicted metal-dependent peptidase
MAEKRINILQVYNLCRELVAKAEASAEKNGGKVDESLLPPLKEAFEKVIEFEKVHLIISHDSFYGAMLMNMVTEIDFTIRGALDLSVKKEPFVLKFNPLFIAKYSYKEFTGAVVSEILMLAFAHPETFARLNAGKDPKVHKNLIDASEVSVSSMVQHDIRLDKKERTNLVIPSEQMTLAKMSEELSLNPRRDEPLEYYFKIYEKFRKYDPEDDSKSFSGGGQGSGNEEEVATRNNSGGKETHQWYDEDPEDIRNKIKAMVGDVYKNLDEKSRGLMPGGLVQQIEKLLKKPEINWKQLLRKFVGTIPVPHRSTRTRLNRRMPERSDLSGKLPKRHVEVVVAIDTSGSMSDSDISYVLNEIFNIVKDYESKITIIECDATIGKVYSPRNMSEVQTKVSGRGGTLFTPVIDYINKEGKFGKAVLIYFTDGYGESSIPKPKTHRNLWVVMQDEKHLSLREPYGDVKSLSKDNDWIKKQS